MKRRTLQLGYFTDKNKQYGRQWLVQFKENKRHKFNTRNLMTQMLKNTKKRNRIFRQEITHQRERETIGHLFILIGR